VAERPIRALVSLDAGIDEAAVIAALPNDPSIQLVGFVQGVEDSWATLQEAATDLLVIACSGYSERALSLIGGTAREYPDLPIVVLSQSSPDGFLGRLFEMGAEDVVRLPEAPERVRFTLQKVVARRRALAAASGVNGGSMICVLGPKGGVGKTVTTSNVASVLAASGKRVVVVDLDLQFGDVALCMGIRPETTIHDLASSPGTLDAEKLEAYLVTHESGARVLVAPTRPDHAASISVDFLRDVYGALRMTNDYVVVDTSPGFTPEVISAIDASSDICMLSMLDTLSLKNTRLGLETLDLMGYDREHTVLVLNRADSRVGISDDDVERIVGRKPEVRVPSDIEITRSVNDGRPIVLSRPKAEAAQSFQRLADVFMGRIRRGGGAGRGGGGVEDLAVERPDAKRGRLHVLARRT
jgi:pilus assembly protein CpaE